MFLLRFSLLNLDETFYANLFFSPFLCTLKTRPYRKVLFQVLEDVVYKDGQSECWKLTKTLELQ